jgi:hypothetical protein
MRAVRKTTALVIRQRSFWKKHVFFAVAAFCLTSAAVYFIWLKNYRKSNYEIGSKATAVVEQEQGMDQVILSADSLSKPSLDLKSIKIRVLSPEFLTQAMRDCGIGISQSACSKGDSPIFVNTKIGTVPKELVITPDQLRQGLNIFTISGTAKGEEQILFELELRQSPEASRIVRALADRFVYEFRSCWTAEMRKTYLAALFRTEQAQNAQRKAVENLQSFKDDITKQERLGKDQQLLQPQTVQSEAVQAVDNPAWVELNEKLTELRGQETEILENKTELHPDVQNIRDRIAEVEQQMAITPRFSAENSQDNLANDGLFPSMDNTLILKNETEIKDSNSTDGMAVIDQNEFNEKLSQLQDEVANTARDYEQELQQEKQIFEASRQEPKFSISINSTAMAIKEPKVNRGIVELMLYSGFAVGVGISVISSGLSAQPVLATIADLEPLLPAPIIGVVPSKDLSFDPVARRRRQLIGRWTMIVAGLLMVLGTIGWINFLL